MMGTNRTLAIAGLAIAGLAGQATAQFKYTSDVPHPPMRAGVGAPQFYDPDLGKWWSCTAHFETNQRSNIDQLFPKWNISQPSDDCFPNATVIVPWRVVTDAWFELDAEGNAIDPDYLPPMEDMDGNEEDLCMRMDLTEILLESMAVDVDENFPVIAEAMEVLERLCDVTFVQRTPTGPVAEACYPSGQPWIRIQQSTDECPALAASLTGNKSAVGMVGADVQILTMEDWSVSVLIHELMHALGFLHEQNRFDRNTYVTIFEDNIDPSALSQFQIAPDASGDFGEYDLESIMHYGRFAFSFNGAPTIDVNPPFDEMGEDPGYETTIGSFARPSVGDRLGLESVYGRSRFNTCDIADLNDDNRVNITDLLLFIAAWSEGDTSIADLDLDGDVDDSDLLRYFSIFSDADNCDPIIPPIYDVRNTTVGRPI